MYIHELCPEARSFKTLNQHHQIDHVLICNDGGRSTPQKRGPLFLPIFELGLINAINARLTNVK